MKFNIGDKLHISGDITVTGAYKCGDGVYSYNTDVGTFREPALDKLVCKPASVKPQGKLKYKVGDKVKMTRNLPGADNRTAFIGKSGTITSILTGYSRGQAYGTDFMNGYVAYEDELEPYIETSKPRFKAGDKAKIVANSAHHYFPIGEIVVLRNSDYDKTWHAEYLDGREWWYVKECDLEPYAEPDKPAFSWDDFKVGKIAVHCDSGEKAKAFCAEAKATIPNICGAWRDGETNWRLNKENTVYGNDCGLCYGPPESWSGYTIIDYPFSAEPAKAPSKEPVKLYCVKDYKPGEWLTKGKTYELSADLSMTMDDGTPTKYDNMTLGDLPFKQYFSKLVSRPAKAGEWVLITKAEPEPRDAYKNGDIFCVERPWDTYPGGVALKAKSFDLFNREYEVLDGYDGRYEPKEEIKPEPKFYSGKVVCVETHDDFTVGKVYTFTDGKVTDDGGENRPMTSYRAETLKSWNEDDGKCHTKFIEYKGEAT